ncbi:hypothetical protein [Streptomyces mutabilis]|uniref:Uncharacterized protein n=1 Tax=Streptomyces mutabilis TaxID=67332 RepID=A0A086MR13_9ACTN|nr:hypothetical protein [Streptomyces mutabilis]KFG71331.1 hypothetical protein FM21_34040 [Streptomyces mutabilis]
MITNVESLAPARVVGEILVAAIHNIAEQNIDGHDLTAAKNRLDGNLSAIVRSANTYAESVKAGKTDEEAKRDAAIAVVHNYRLEHNL